MNIKPLFYIIGLIGTQQVMAAYGFDRMRCQGKLIEKYDTLDYVQQYCGEPLELKHWANQYQNKKILTYKATRAQYTMVFINDRLVDSRQEAYGY